MLSSGGHKRCLGSKQAKVVEPDQQVDSRVATALVDLFLDYSQLPPDQEVHTIDCTKDLTGLVEIDHPDFVPYEPEPSADPPGATHITKAKTYWKEIVQNLESYIPAPAEKRLLWSRGSLQNPIYDPPEGNREQEVMVVPVDVLDSPKRQIVAFSDCHLVGPKYTEAHITRLLRTMATFAEDESLHTLVVAGDMLEMWCQPHDEVRMTDQQLVEGWESDEACQKFLQSLLLLIKNGVHVYYILGNHDHTFKPWMADQLGFTRGDRFHVVKGILILEVKVDGRLYRVRFEHGHDADLFNTYGGWEEKDLIGGEPVGHVGSRAGSKRDGNMLPTMEAKHATAIPLYTVLGPQLLQILCSRQRSERYMRNALEAYLGRKITEDDVVIYQDNQYLNLRKYLRFQLAKRCIDRHGLVKAFTMYKAAMHDYSDFVRTCGEDVVVLGHTHKWNTGRFTGKGGHDILYVNTGAWCTRVKEPTYARIIPPTSREDGLIEVVAVTE